MTEDELSALADKVMDRILPKMEDFHKRHGDRQYATNGMIRKLTTLVEEQNARQAKMARAVLAIAAPDDPASGTDD